eukprot:scaffold130388_cov51-Phaeocystis_antarctica.AAC.2
MSGATWRSSTAAPSVGTSPAARSSGARCCRPCRSSTSCRPSSSGPNPNPNPNPVSNPNPNPNPNPSPNPNVVSGVTLRAALVNGLSTLEP